MHYRNYLGRLFVSGPGWVYRRIWADALVATLLATLVLSGAGIVAGAGTSGLFAENGIHEMLQSAVLTLGVLAGLLGALRAQLVARYAALATGLICFICFFREIPNCDENLRVFCTSGPSDHYLIGAGILLLLAATGIAEWLQRGTVLQAVNPRFSWPLAVASVSLILSQLAEGLHLLRLEETLELYGYVVLMLGAGWLCAHPSALERSDTLPRETL